MKFYLSDIVTLVKHCYFNRILANHCYIGIYLCLFTQQPHGTKEDRMGMSYFFFLTPMFLTGVVVGMLGRKNKCFVR